MNCLTEIKDYAVNVKELRYAIECCTEIELTCMDPCIHSNLDQLRIAMSQKTLDIIEAKSSECVSYTRRNRDKKIMGILVVIDDSLGVGEFNILEVKM